MIAEPTGSWGCPLPTLVSEADLLRARIPASETEWREIERRLAELEQRS
ncbi:MAG TPA: hypothetical protein VK988_01980 [Acidimicrobiales bacterium]|jgi:hypothetical protein|nr:hypothetical protein [Acidimicrobiales bacterium]